MRRSLELYRRLLAAQFRGQLHYRFAFALDVLSTAMFTVIEFGAFALVFASFPNMGGWTFQEVAFLYGMVEFSFGLMDMIFAGFDPPVFAQHIRKGTLDQFMLRPANLMLQIFGSDFTLRRIGRVTLGASILGYAIWQNQIDWTLEKLVYMPLVVLGMVLFFGALFMIGSTITIWTVENTEAMNILTYGGGYLIAYPMTIYADWFRQIFTFIIPAIFLNYAPALYFLGKPDPLELPAFAPFLAPVVGFVLFGFAVQFWKVGLNRYQSVGN
jgi:ABC-2 type transport system permease protein